MRRRLLSLILILPAYLTSCASLPPVHETSESQIAVRNDDELFASLPENLRSSDVLHQQVRVIRLEITGNPRHAKWEQVDRGKAVVVSVDRGMMRLRLLAGKADPGDRVVCCYGTVDDPDKIRPVRSNLATGLMRNPASGRKKPGGSVRDSVLSD